MVTTVNHSYDAIIIGTGISGLVCGCYLAKAGMRVLIVEQHDKPGGYFTSFRRKGYLFDAAAHSFGNYREGGHVRKIFSELGVDQILTVKRFNPSDVIITPDFNMIFWNDVTDTMKNISDIFPLEQNNIQNFFKHLLTAEKLELASLKSKTFKDFLELFIDDERLINTLSFPVFGNGGLPPSLMHAFSGSKIFSEFIIDGGYYPVGGIQMLPNSLATIIEQHYGKILYKRRVNKILTENHSVIGVELDGNESFRSKYVISSCDMTQTFSDLLGEKAIGKKIINNIKKRLPSLSTFILYLGIDKTFKELPAPGINIWYLPYYDLDKMYQQINKSNFDQTGIMLRVSPDQKTLTAYFGATYRTLSFWRKNKKRVTQNFIERLEKLIPNLRNHISYVDAATPHTLHKYTRNYKGASFGWAKTVAQTFDPMINKKSIVQGLYLTGHWTTLAFGLPGASYTGQNIAKIILRKEAH